MKISDEDGFDMHVNFTSKAVFSRWYLTDIVDSIYHTYSVQDNDIIL